MRQRARVATSIAAVLLLAAGACTSDPQVKAQKYVASGDAYLAKHENNRALIEYKRAVQVRPEWADAHYKLAKVYELEGDAPNAYHEYARTGDLDLSNTDAQVKAGLLLLAAGEFEAARTRAELALKAAPDSAPANILLGNALAGLNETDKAVKQIEQAISLDPSYAPAWTALGAVQFRAGTRDDAANAFQKAVDAGAAFGGSAFGAREFSVGEWRPEHGGTDAEDGPVHRSQKYGNTPHAGPAVPFSASSR